MHVLVSLLNINGCLFEQADSLFEDLNKIGEIVVCDADMNYFTFCFSIFFIAAIKPLAECLPKKTYPNLPLPNTAPN
jgi:hypothetical protein